MFAAAIAFSSEVEPVRVKKTRQIRNLEPRFDSIETEKALAPEMPHSISIALFSAQGLLRTVSNLTHVIAMNESF